MDVIDDLACRRSIIHTDGPAICLTNDRRWSIERVVHQRPEIRSLLVVEIDEPATVTQRQHQEVARCDRIAIRDDRGEGRTAERTRRRAAQRTAHGSHQGRGSIASVSRMARTSSRVVSGLTKQKRNSFSPR